MFVYEKRLQYPIKIKQTNPKLAKIIITQYGGAYFKCYKNSPKGSSFGTWNKVSWLTVMRINS